uniref:Uncharacterized protein n=1 Tax=Dromaius novaehollandiae TaxID=8790 RepID=A0A8C4PDE5_DRONO
MIASVARTLGTTCLRRVGRQLSQPGVESSRFLSRSLLKASSWSVDLMVLRYHHTERFKTRMIAWLLARQPSSTST